MELQKTLVKQACDIVGSQAALSRILGVSTGMVNQMVQGKRPVPVAHCLGIEKATKGVVTRRMLLPHDFQRIWGSATSKQRRAAPKQTA